MKPQIRTPYNKLAHGKGYEKNSGLSETVPDQSMSVPELLRRHARGLPLGGGRFEIYEGEEFVPDFKKLDLSEIHEMTRQNQEQIKTLQDEINKKQIAVAKAKEEERIRKQLMDELQQKKDPESGK